MILKLCIWVLKHSILPFCKSTNNPPKNNMAALPNRFNGITLHNYKDLTIKISLT